MKKVLAISGSTRKNSSNEKILLALGDLFKDKFQLAFFEGIDTLPHFNPDLDNENLPESVQSFRDQIENADAVLICTPEYVFSIPGSLKNAIEWNVSTTLFSGKPVGIIVASASGEKAFESLKLVMTTIEAVVPNESTLLIKGVKGKVGKDGSVHQETNALLKVVGESLIKAMNAKDKMPTKYRDLT